MRSLKMVILAVCVSCICFSFEVAAQSQPGGEAYSAVPTGLIDLWLVATPDGVATQWTLFEQSQAVAVTNTTHLVGPFADLQAQLSINGLTLESVDLVSGELVAADGSRRAIHGVFFRSVHLEPLEPAADLLVVLGASPSLEVANAQNLELLLGAEDVITELVSSGGDEIQPIVGPGDEAASCIECRNGCFIEFSIGRGRCMEDYGYCMGQVAVEVAACIGICRLAPFPGCPAACAALGAIGTAICVNTHRVCQNRARTDYTRCVAACGPASM